MRLPLLSVGALAGLAALVSCERKSDAPEAEEPTAERVEALLSDELPGLSAPATGVAFWEHPTLSFNSLLIVANENGVVSYNMENGTEVSRIDGFNARGAAVSYIGFGPQAAGFLAFFDDADSLFRFYGIDNASRAFLPLDDGPAIRGAVRDFCMGRSSKGNTPILFAVQNAKIQFFGLEANADGVAVADQGEINSPDDLVSCAVDQDGVLLLAADDGALYRLNGEDAFKAPFAEAAAKTVGDIAIVGSSIAEGDTRSVREQVLLLDENDGALHVFDMTEGRGLGVVDFAGTDQMPGAGHARLMNASSANLGALYRDGAIGLGAIGDDGPVIRIAPKSSLLNALSVPVGDPVSPRGAAPQADDGLLISPPEIGDQPD